MNPSKTKNRTIRKLLYHIKHNHWDQPVTRHFFKDTSIGRLEKLTVLFLMSKKNLKFQQIKPTDAPNEIKRKLIDIFGLDEDKKLSIVHLIACALNLDCRGIIEKKIFENNEIEKQVRKLNDYGESALHLACSKKASVEVIRTITDIGGLDLVLERDSGGYTALHNACIFKASSDNIKHLLNLGGKDLVLTAAKCGRTALHWACFHDVSYDVIEKIIELGGKELVMATDANNRKAVHIATIQRASIATIRRLIDVGGKDLLCCENPLGPEYGNLFLHFFIATAFCCCKESQDKFVMLILKGIEHGIGGEFSIGGLLNTAPDNIQEHVFDCWIGRVDRCLKKVLEKHEKLPILHAAIMAKAPRHVIRNLIESHEDVISIQDSKGRYPIDVAVEEGQPWNNGLKEVLSATMKTPNNFGRSLINVAALHGVHWANGLNQIVSLETNIKESNRIAHLDLQTNLYPFMLAAAGPNYDLSAIFELTRRNPDLLLY